MVFLYSKCGEVPLVNLSHVDQRLIGAKARNQERVSIKPVSGLKVFIYAQTRADSPVNGQAYKNF